MYSFTVTPVFLAIGPLAITLIVIAAILVAGQATDFLVITPLGTVVTVLAKGTLCGLIAGLVYTALSKKNRWVAIIVAAVVCPVVNTGVFLLGCLLFFMDTLNGSGLRKRRCLHGSGSGWRQFPRGDRRERGAGSGDLAAHCRGQKEVRGEAPCC